VGRLVFAGWKLVAEEVKHPNVSYLQSVVFSVLGKRIPYHDNLRLTEWYSHAMGRERWRVIYHRLVQSTATLLLFDALDIIGRAGEAARLSGVEFSESFPSQRGSQYKVEGVLLRALQSLNSDERGSKLGRRPEFASACSSSWSSEPNSPWKSRRRSASIIEVGEGDTVEKSSCNLSGRGYFFYSPSLQDANKQEALEKQALTMEPESGHFEDPVIVCDFTALYPSLIIAYNLCYSTLCGHIEYHSSRDEMMLKGRTTGQVGPFNYPEARTATVLHHHVKSTSGGRIENDRAYVAPNGSIYVSESVVKGVLPQVLDEMLSTRAMLKKAGKSANRLSFDVSISVKTHREDVFVRLHQPSTIKSMFQTCLRRF
jgi:DNA polymerase elongation subunit (family B)